MKNFLFAISGLLLALPALGDQPTGQFEYGVSRGRDVLCFLQRDGRPVGKGMRDFSLCDRYGLNNSFEFDVGAKGLTRCFLQRQDRSVGRSMKTFDQCAMYGKNNTFAFGLTKRGTVACFLQRKGRSVGTSVPNQWCSSPDGRGFSAE